MSVTPTLEVVRPGIVTTAQDAGRPGYRAFGVPPSGALDIDALRLLNTLLDNDRHEAALECLYGGIVLRVKQGTARCAAACADARIRAVNGTERQVPAWTTFLAREAEMIIVDAPRNTAAAYLGFSGGMDADLIMQSRSTNIPAGFGGCNGRSLKRGDTIALRAAAESGSEWHYRMTPTLDRPDSLRVMKGPQHDWFDDAMLQRLFDGDYAVTPASNRAGIRLEGEPLVATRGHDLLSEGVASGSIQVPGSGQPILLIGDHPTVGGYPKIATVISADLAAAGRLRIGGRVRFTPVDEKEAARARHVRRETFGHIASSRARVA